ncbi:MAG: sucrase ferredoxin [Rhodococcus sp. (in: high G+C Gram-positive bacteria)]
MTFPSIPCSDGARLRGDALAGTASPGLRWFLAEVDGPWGHSAFLNADRVLDSDLGLAIARRVEAEGMRVLAIRRPGRLRGEGRWRWAIVDSRIGSASIHWGEVSSPEQLLTVPLDASTGVSSEEPIVAVCAHGRHDRCCAVRGRRVLPALLDRHADITWECSHLGGDRFAGTMVVFPEGLYYGNVDEADAASLVDDHRRGLVVQRFFRGRSSLPAPVQAAQHHARELLNEYRIDALDPLSVTQDGTDWTVVLAHRTPVTVVVRQGLSDPITTTCNATKAGPVRTFECVSVSTQ